MSHFLPARKKINAGIDLTPLIDVVFQLLIFLLVSSQFITTPDEVKVDLPQSKDSATPLDREEKAHLLSITGTNKLYLNGEEIAPSQLAQKVSELVSQSKVHSMEIRGDRESRLALFIEAIETAKNAGIVSLSYHKEPVAGAAAKKEE